MQPPLFASMLIALHLGAHKTATTYIQQALDLSRDALNAAHIGCPPLDRIRPTVTRRLDFPGFGLGAATRRLLDEYRNCDRIILSDENIMGGLKPARATNTLYGRAGGRVRALVRNLASDTVNVFFAVRSYDEFVSAIYCEYIRHNPFTEADRYLSKVNVAAFSWIDVVGKLVDAAGAENVTLWRYEDFPLVQDEVFAALTGAAGLVEKTPKERLRESFSADAVKAVSRLPSMRDANERRMRVKQVASAFPKGPDHPPFSAFDPNEAQALRARYAEDISGIERRFPGVKLLRSVQRQSRCEA